MQNYNGIHHFSNKMDFEDRNGYGFGFGLQSEAKKSEAKRD